MNDSKTHAPRVQHPEGWTFGMIYTPVYRDQTLPYAVKLVYGYLATWRNAKTIAPSRALIADSVGLSVRSVDKALAIGRDVGLWRIQVRPVEGKRNDTNTYELMDQVGGYVPGSGPVIPKQRQGAGDAPYGDGPADGASPDRDRVQEVLGVGAGAAQETHKLQTEKKDSSAPRHHADARRIENHAQAIKHHQHRLTAQGRAARRRWELDGVTASWLTRGNPYLGADIENYVDHKWGCEGNVRNLIADMVTRVQKDGEYVPPRKILNAALKDARWIDDEPPTKYAEIGLADFTPVLAMPADDQEWYIRDDYTTYEDIWDAPAPPANPVPAPAAVDLWDLGPGNPF